VITAVFAAIVSSFILVLNTVNSGKIRTAATALANEQMESLRNLPYEDLSTAGGTVLPQGTILDSQTLTRSNVSFALATTIITVDDPFDGCAIPAGTNLYECTDGGTASIQDVIPTDYKRISVEVSKAGTATVLARLVSNAAAKAAETSGNTGMLLIKIVDANGQPVSGATVTVTNPVTGVNVTGVTNAQGYVFIANIPPDNQNGYHIVVTKDGYSTDYTTPRTAQNPNQHQPDVDVNVQEVTIQTLAIDQLSTMNVTVKNEAGSAIPNIQITATGSKITQINPELPKNVYTQTTNASGVATFTDIEWDGYAITVPSGYQIISTSPYQLVDLQPSSTMEVVVAATTNSNWPVITSVNPSAGITGTSVDIAIEGDNFTGGSTVLLRRQGQSDVLPANTNVAPNEKSIDVTFSLSGVATGAWDLVIISSGQTVTQIEGFIVS
jgi:hypothetical protein